MTIELLKKLFQKENVQELPFVLAFTGTCQDCGKKTEALATWKENGAIEITGGAVCDINKTGIPEEFSMKCEKCFKKNKHFGRRTEIYSRCVGYLRPVSQWNAGKQAEFKTRKFYDTKKALKAIS